MADRQSWSYFGSRRATRRTCLGSGLESHRPTSVESSGAYAQCRPGLSSLGPPRLEFTHRFFALNCHDQQHLSLLPPTPRAPTRRRRRKRFLTPPTIVSRQHTSRHGQGRIPSCVRDQEGPRSAAHAARSSTKGGLSGTVATSNYILAQFMQAVNASPPLPNRTGLSAGYPSQPPGRLD